MKRLLTTLVVALALTASMTALAERGERNGSGPDWSEDDGHRGRHGPPGHEVLIENADDLGIDAETQAMIIELADNVRPEMDALRDQMRSAADRDERHALRDQMHDLGRGMMEDIMAMLTVEQQEAAKDILPPPPGERGERMGKRGGQHGQRGDCDRQDEAR